MDEKSLIRAAVKARELSYSPYSGFMVGAALLAKSGRIFTGCNVENAAFGPGDCAERTAFVKAASEGEREFVAIVVAGWPRDGAPGFAYPCGVCRQIMAEFCGPEFKIFTAKSPEEYETRTLGELLPHSFGSGNL